MTAEQKAALSGALTVDPNVMHGAPCFAGTRVPVQTLLDFLEAGETIDHFLAVYHWIPREQVVAFLELAKDIAIEELTCASS